MKSKILWELRLFGLYKNIYLVFFFDTYIKERLIWFIIFFILI